MATAAEVITTNDIVVKILSPSGQVLTASDTATSPEVATYTAASIPGGIYSMQVCPFDDPTVPFTAPGDYAGGVTTSDTGAPTTPSTGNPKWRYFPANPSLDWSPSTTPGNSVIGCWTAAAGCTSPTGCVPQRGRSRPVGLHRQDGDTQLHDRRQQRQHARGVGQPVDPRRSGAGTGVAHA